MSDTLTVYHYVYDPDSISIEASAVAGGVMCLSFGNYPTQTHVLVDLDQLEALHNVVGDVIMAAKIEAERI